MNLARSAGNRRVQWRAFVLSLRRTRIDLHPRERRTITEMNAVAEGDVAAVLTVIEIVRRIELPRIAVRRIHHAENLLTALEGFAVDLQVFQHAPSQRAHWSTS